MMYWISIKHTLTDKTRCFNKPLVSWLLPKHTLLVQLGPNLALACPVGPSQSWAQFGPWVKWLSSQIFHQRQLGTSLSHIQTLTLIHMIQVWPSWPSWCAVIYEHSMREPPSALWERALNWIGLDRACEFAQVPQFKQIPHFIGNNTIVCSSDSGLFTCMMHRCWTPAVKRLGCALQKNAFF